ncbi:MAG TPA: YceI family protein [Gemmatimonadales bacterium]|jgi:polyisoprenoid-binding protein YceI
MTFTHMVLLLSVAGAPLAAQSPTGLSIPDGSVRQGTLSFDGRATVGNFTGTTTTVTGEFHGGPLSEVRGWVEAPVRSLATGNEKRDRDLNKSMESDKYPTIRFELTGVDAPGARSDSMAVSLHGRFIIHGVTREATIPASLGLAAEGIRVRGETPLNLKDYKIGGLTKLLGMLKMYEEIVVHVDLVFGSAAPRHEALR